MIKFSLFIFSLCFISFSSQAATLIDLNFNSGLNSQGNLVFNGAGNFQVTLTDDDSNGSEGGQAAGVHITNQNYGNSKVGSTTDFVLGAYNNYNGGLNYHSSGIVAIFNQGVTRVTLFDSDDDSTLKTLYAFNQAGTLIGQTSASSRITFDINTGMTTGGQLIWKVEFDTAAGTAGGSNDGTYFTIDNFHVEGTAIPEPATITLLCLASLMALCYKKNH